MSLHKESIHRTVSASVELIFLGDTGTTLHMDDKQNKVDAPEKTRPLRLGSTPESPAQPQSMSLVKDWRCLSEPTVGSFYLVTCMFTQHKADSSFQTMVHVSMNHCLCVSTWLCGWGSYMKIRIKILAKSEKIQIKDTPSRINLMSSFSLCIYYASNKNVFKFQEKDFPQYVLSYPNVSDIYLCLQMLKVFEIIT